MEESNPRSRKYRLPHFRILGTILNQCLDARPEQESVTEIRAIADVKAYRRLLEYRCDRGSGIRSEVKAYATSVVDG